MQMKSRTKTPSCFIIPIMGQAQQGCGFFVGNYFITAGHVIENYDGVLSIWFDGKEIELDRHKALIICNSNRINEDGSDADFAVFSVDEVDSPLEFADYKPTPNQKLRCVTYDTVFVEDDKPGIPKIFAYKDEIVKVEAQATVRQDTLGNYFACNTTPNLKKGNSGSPLLDSDNNVVGILRGGTYSNMPECCIFQYVDIIKALLKQES